MVKIRLHSYYDHFRNHSPGAGDKFIHCYNDIFAIKREQIRSDDIALLIEPRFIQPDVYTYVEQHYFEFAYVFTHDTYLLNNIPNARLIIWGGVWGWSDEEKDKMVSMVASHKANDYWRKERVRLANLLSDKSNPLSEKVDVFGTFNGGPRVDTKTIYSRYKFSIAMENSIDDYWITEKICNCFSNKTIPIYIGANEIDELFNPDGILTAHSVDDVLEILHDPYLDEMYESRKDAIEDNYVRVKKYAVFENWFYHEYGELLEGVYNGAQTINNHPLL